MKENRKIPQMWTIAEAAVRTGISTYYVRQLVTTGKIKFVKSGRKYLVNAASLCDFLERGEESVESGEQ